ncbi:hypothetical protein ACFS2C_28210 [Prauserella oleivorans]|uniref:PE domain-containing protein n=1 Tax=Prauserella oleivorans TaxID=1478153 RepID=A0ABW5WH16_9PSEU
MDTAWQAAHASGSSASASAQLPANVVVAMVDAAERGTRALAGIADVIVQQYDSGNAYQDAASALHRASNTWPAR